MNDQRGLVVHFDDARHFSMLSDAQLGMLFRAMVHYAETGEPTPIDDPAVSMCFSFLSARVDRDNAAYLEKCEKNRANGAKGGRPKKPNGFSKNQTVSEKTQKTLSLSLPVSLSENKSTGEDKPPQPAHKRFTPPTVDDVRSYCSERKNTVDPQRWFDYYSANGWMVGKNHMKDWKAAVRTWESKEQEKKLAAQVKFGWQED